MRENELKSKECHGAQTSMHELQMELMLSPSTSALCGRASEREDSPAALAQFLDIFQLVSAIHLNPEAPDTITWRWTSDGQYNDISAYIMQFECSIRCNFLLTVWNSEAPSNAPSLFGSQSLANATQLTAYRRKVDITMPLVCFVSLNLKQPCTFLPPAISPDRSGERC